MKKIALFLALIILILSILILPISALTLAQSTLTSTQYSTLTSQIGYGKNEIEILVITPESNKIEYFSYTPNTTLQSQNRIFHPDGYMDGNVVFLRSMDNGLNYTTIANDDNITTGYNFENEATNNRIKYSSHDLYMGTDPSQVFFYHPKITLTTQLQSLPQNLQPSNLPHQAFGTLVPLVIGCLVFFLAFRKGYSFLLQQLNKA